MRNSGLETRNSKLETRDTGLETWNMAHKISNNKSRITGQIPLCGGVPAGRGG